MTFLGYDGFQNDASMIPTYAVMFFIAISIFSLAIFFHELGHIWYFKQVLKKEVKTRLNKKRRGFEFLVGEPKDYKNLSQTEYKYLNASGVIFGLFPICLVAFVIPSALLILVPYLYGCRQDLREIVENIEWEEDI